MAIRPFYIDANIEGRKTPLAGGPRTSDGYMTVTITQRDEGAIKTAYTIRSYRSGDELYTQVYDHRGVLVSTFKTTY